MAPISIGKNTSSQQNCFDSPSPMCLHTFVVDKTLVVCCILIINKWVSAKNKIKITKEEKSSLMLWILFVISLTDVCLPAVFMPPASSAKASVYNPRAAKYFHASGATGVRLTQPPSMVQLPPIPKNVSL